MVADDGDHLFSGSSLHVAINRDADGNDPGFMWDDVWTFSLSNGTYQGYDCNGGTLSDNSMAWGGNRKQYDEDWINDSVSNGSFMCQSTNVHIYCMGR